MKRNSSEWLFAWLDVWRRLQGEWMEVWGWGPARSASEIVLRERGMTLRRYSPNSNHGPVVLAVPAPIKRAYVWNLQPGGSVIQKLVESGCRVFLTEWEVPGRGVELMLADYSERFLRLSQKAIQQSTGEGGPIFLASHSLGGVFTAIYAALYPARVAGLILVSTPLCFGARQDALSRFVARNAYAEDMLPGWENVPGTFLNAVSLAAAPETFGYARQRDLARSLGEPGRLKTHLRVLRWSMDEMPLGRRLFQETVKWLYREDRLMRGTLKIGNRRVSPDAVKAPLLLVTEVESAVAPPESMLPFCEATSSVSKKVLWYEEETGVGLQHLGPLVGKNAHAKLWPVIVDWIQAQARLQRIRKKS